MNNESQSVKELEEVVADKKKIYTSLLKENPPLYKIHRMIKFTDAGGLLGMCLALVGIFNDLSISLIGVVIFVATIAILYSFNSRFDRLFAETASDPLKNARKEYEECEQRLKEAKEASNKAKKEAERAKLQAEIEEAEQVNNHYKENITERKRETAEQILTEAYNREVVSPQPVHTTDLSDMIGKNAFLAQSFLDKVIVLFGDIIKIDYDKFTDMPYVLIGTRHRFSSDVYDEYACYFSFPKEVEKIKWLQAGNMIVVCGIFSRNERPALSRYCLTKSQILDSDNEH